MRSQPKALYLLNFVSMWETFGYYGMRALLVLYMIHELKFSDAEAFVLYALYTTLVELGGLIGGILADRLFGLKRCIQIGGWAIALGHASLSMASSKVFFFLGLGLVIAGTSLFRSNMSAFVGRFYEKGDPRIETGYTPYYAGLNVGGFLAAIVCGAIGELYGWEVGFSLAAFGMIVGNIALMAGNRLLQPKVEEKKEKALVGVLGVLLAAPLLAFALYKAPFVTAWLPIPIVLCLFYVYRSTACCSAAEKQNLKTLAIFVCFLIAFFACEELLGSALVLFGERHIDRETLFGTFPSSSLITFNPLTILVFGPLMGPILQRVGLLSNFVKINGSFLLLSLSFGLLSIACLIASEKIGLGSAIASIFLLSLGELLIGPTIFATASRVAPEKIQGITMGIVTFGFSMANLLSGLLSQMMAITETADSLTIYMKGFSLIALVSLAIFMLFTPKKVVQL